MALLAQQGINVLSLDGGGIKGYTTLLVLKRIFRTIQDKAGLDAEPLPCDIFDLIVGTSTGGLIAIMLGRLQMSLDECLEHYRKIGSTVFGSRLAGGKIRQLAKAILKSPLYSTAKLQSSIDELLKSCKDRAPDECFVESGQLKCRV